MNRHFEDARYYVKRAGKHAKKGVTEELKPVETRLRKLRGEEEPEPSRLDKIRTELDRAEGEAREVVADARRRVRRNRPN